MAILRKMAERVDGWVNLITSLGKRGADKRLAARAQWDPQEEHECENNYAGDDVARRIVDQLSQDMTKKGWEFSGEEIDTDVSQSIKRWFAKRKIKDKIEKALADADIYGGAAIVLGVDDGMDPAMPVDWENVTTLRYAVNLHRYELWPATATTDPESPNYGLPEHYYISPRRTGHNASPNNELKDHQLVHWTRILRFEGVRLPKQMFIANQCWHDSLISVLRNAIRTYSTSFDAVAALIQDLNQGVYKVDGFSAIIASNDEKLILKRLEMIDQARSILNAVVIDKDGEDFERKTTSLTNLDKILTKLETRLSTATGMPRTVLFGESPNGLSGQGGHEKENYYDYIERRQEKKLTDPLSAFFEICMRDPDGPTKGKVLDVWDLSFHPLGQVSQQDEAEIRAKMAEADERYVGMGVLDPDEVAQSRFGTGKFNMEIKLNPDLRDKDGRLAVRDEPVDNEPAPEPPESTDDPNKPGDDE